MKQIKVFLTAGAIFAIVGTSLAFKANFGTGRFACLPLGISGICPMTSDFIASISGTALHCGTVPGSITQCQANQPLTRVVPVPK